MVTWLVCGAFGIACFVIGVIVKVFMNHRLAFLFFSKFVHDAVLNVSQNLLAMATTLR